MNYCSSCNLESEEQIVRVKAIRSARKRRKLKYRKEGIAREKECQKKDCSVKKVNRTLAEALISSRLHRPRSEPLGASLPSN